MDFIDVGSLSNDQQYYYFICSFAVCIMLCKILSCLGGMFQSLQLGSKLVTCVLDWFALQVMGRRTPAMMMTTLLCLTRKAVIVQGMP